MKRNPNTSKLTKAFIESKVSQETILSKYLNINISIIKDCIEKNHLIKSVFRNDDTNGSMGIQYNNKGRLKVRDFGGFGFFDDVYGVIAYVLSNMYNRKIDTNNKQDFYFILKHIARTFSSLIDGTEVDNSVDIEIDCALQNMSNRKPIIEIAPRSWNKQDKEIWNKWGVGLNYLNTHFVVPVEQYYIDRGPDSSPLYTYNTKDPCYGYILGQNKQGITLIKLYFPYRNRTNQLKFITNCNVLEGLINLELDNYDYILITKSSKDRLSIGSHIINTFFYGGGSNKLNIGIVNLPSESYKLKDNEYEYLCNKLSFNGQIISLLDFDKTGRDCAKYLLEEYSIRYIFITRGEFGLPNYKAKDFADLHDYYSNDEIDNFIKETITYLNIDKYYENDTPPYMGTW